MKKQEKYFELCNYKRQKTMIRQDYLIRMIQEIFAAITNLILRRKRLNQADWEEYESTARQILGVTPEQLAQMDGGRLLDQYQDEQDGIEKIELAAMMMLKMAEDTKDIVPKARLQQEGVALLKYVQTHGKTYSLPRELLIQFLESRH